MMPLPPSGRLQPYLALNCFIEMKVFFLYLFLFFFFGQLLLIFNPWVACDEQHWATGRTYRRFLALQQRTKLCKEIRTFSTDTAIDTVIFNVQELHVRGASSFVIMLHYIRHIRESKLFNVTLLQKKCLTLKLHEAVIHVAAHVFYPSTVCM